MEKKDVVVAVDIGTTKIYAIIAEIIPDKKSFQVIGHAMSTSRGMNKGTIVDVNEVTADVEAALKSAEHMTDIQVRKVFVGVAGKHIESLMSHGMVVLSKNSPKEIEDSDREKLEELAVNKVVPIDRKVIHKIVYNYRIDDGGVVKNPVGMKGIKLEADVHIVTGIVHSIDSIVKSINNLSIEVEDIVLEPLASAKAVLSDTEKKLGAVLVDIGGGTTDIAIFRNDKLIYTSVIPLGGEHFTHDIATVLNIDIKTADRLKKEFSNYIEADDADLEQVIEIPTYNQGEIKKVKLSYLKEIIDERIKEVVEHIKKKIDASGFGHLAPNGIIFTGGSSKIAGLQELAAKYFKMPVRLGVPLKTEGLLESMNKPEDATGVGLLLYGIEKYFSGNTEKFKRKADESDSSWAEAIKEKVKSWFDIFF